MSSMNVCLNCTWSSCSSAKNQLQIKPASVGSLHITKVGRNSLWALPASCMSLMSPAVLWDSIILLWNHSCKITPVEDPGIKFMSSESQFSALTLDVRVSLVSIQIKLISVCIKASIGMGRLFHRLIVQALQQLGHSSCGGSTQEENVRCSLAPCKCSLIERKSELSVNNQWELCGSHWEKLWEAFLLWQ